MFQQILLYGANGFSGRIVAEAAARKWKDEGSRFELLLAGRDAHALARMGRDLGVQTRVVALDDERGLDAVLGADGVFAVVNAAGPFEATAMPLVKAALRNRRHYVDINGEADVYRRLDDYGYVARQLGVAIVGGAGHCATTSNVMLASALKSLAAEGVKEVGTVRIAYSHVKYVSRGSAQTAWRSIREKTMVVRSVAKEQDKPARRRQKHGMQAMAAPEREYHLEYEPCGKIEREFDFGDVSEREKCREQRSPRRIAMLVNLLDLLAARITLARNEEILGHRIESFIEMPEGARIFVQLGAFSAPLYALPAWRRLVRAQVDMLPEGPNAQERKEDRHTVLLQIDDGAGRMLIDWRMETPDPYDYTADCVIGVIEGLSKKNPTGWCTPAEMFEIGTSPELTSEQLFARCKFESRNVGVVESLS
jgi:short subunit dehydrogenase-like uncharacterized protein